MTIKTRMLALVTLIVCLSAPIAARTLQPIAAFLAEPAMIQVVLAPDGRHVAALLRDQDGLALDLMTLADKQRRRAASLRQVERISLTSDSQVLILESGRRLAFLDLQGTRPTFFAELDATTQQTLVSVDPSQARAVLVSERDGDTHRLIRRHVDGQSEVLLEEQGPFGRVVLDAKGRIVLRQVPGRDREGKLALRIVEPTPIGERELASCDGLDSCTPMGFDSQGRLLLRARLDRDRRQLWAIPLSGFPPISLHEDPQGLADLVDITLGPDGQPLFAVYDTDQRRIHGLEPAVEAELQSLRKLFPERNLDIQVGGATWLLSESGSDLQHPRYYLYDRKSQALENIFAIERLRNVAIDESQLRPSRHFSYPASDGRTIYGFVHVPARLETPELRRAAPMVVRVHGGPWNHVRRDFSAITQLLVDRGAIVFEPNFRASTGYGRAFLDAAHGDFGDGRVQQDILDGVDFLLSQGLGNPERLAIVGHSFGGFSVLGALAFTPERFRAGFASAPPIDLAKTLLDLDDDRILENGLNQREVVESLLLPFDDPRQAQNLRRRSPEAHLDKTVRPLLILAGGADERVDIADVKHYAQALASLGRDISLFVDADQGHSLDGRLATRAYLHLLERFLAATIGLESPCERDAEVEAYLERTILLIGKTWSAGCGQ